MYIIKVMKRKDAASVLVAIVLAMILSTALNQLTAKWAIELSGLGYGRHSYTLARAGWQSTYLYPIMSVILQVVVLEVVIYAYTALCDALKKK